MATTTEERPSASASGETRSRRSAAVQSEPRGADGRWASKGATSARRASSRAKSGGDYSTGTIVGAAAAGLAIGLAANVARKFAVQAPTLLAGDWDQALAGEHQLTLKVFDTLQATKDSATTKRVALLANLKHMLSKHAMEEENVIYPALREIGEVASADALNKEHGYVKQYLYELTELPKDSPFFLEKLGKFRAEIESHMNEEERNLFPLLKSRLSPERNKELTAQMNKEGLKIA